MSYSPYQKKSPGDVLKLQDWLEIQQHIKQELRDHRHLGVDRDGDIAPAQIGPRIERGAFEPGAITGGKLAEGSVGEVALAPGAIGGQHFDPDQRLTESYLKFRSTGGHDHDGVNSRALPAAAVATRHIQDGAIDEAHLEGAPGSDDLTPEEESYAQGRAFTPGNVLRAARQLIDHTGMRQRPLLAAGDYQGIEGTPIIVNGFLLDELVDEDDPTSADYLWLELHVYEGALTKRMPLQILDEERVRATVPALGAASSAGHVRIMRGAGSESLPMTPVTNAVAFTYVPSTAESQAT